MNTVTQQILIDLYQLKPHPEGGYFKETYRDNGVIAQKALPKHFSGDRNIQAQRTTQIISQSKRRDSFIKLGCRLK